MSPAGWTDFLEQHLGRWSVPHLARGLVAMNAASWLLNLASPGFLAILKLDPALVLQGEFWRVITFIFVPPFSAHPIFFFLFLWFLWSIGEALEENLGSYHLNLYFLVSMAAVVGVSFLQPAVPVNSFYLFNALFLGFATTLPDPFFRIHPRLGRLPLLGIETPISILVELGDDLLPFRLHIGPTCSLFGFAQLAIAVLVIFPL